MTLLRYEIKKLSGARFLRALLVLSVLLNGLLSYRLAPVEEDADAHRLICRLVSEDPKGMKAYQEELEQFRRDYTAKARAEKENIKYVPPPVYPCTFTGDPDLNDYVLLRYYATQIEGREEKVAADLDRVIHAAIVHRDDLSGYHPVDPSSFLYRRQLLIEARYREAREELTVLPVWHTGWGTFFRYRFTGAFLCVFLAALGSFVFLNERNGMGCVLLPSPGGRGKTVAAKLAAALLASVAALLLLDGAALLGVWAKCGLSPLGESVQVFPELTYVPYAVTVGKFLWVTELFRALAAASVCVLFLVLSLLLRSRPLSFLAGVVVTGGCYALLLFGNGGAATVFDPALVFSTGDFFEKLRTVNFFSRPVDDAAAASVFFALVLCAGAVPCFLLFRRAAALSSSAVRLPAFLRRVKPKERKKRARTFFLLPHEAAKTLSGVSAVLLLAVLAVLRWNTASGIYQRTRDYNAVLYREYLETYGGQITEEKREAILAEAERIRSAIEDTDQKIDELQSGEITLEEFVAFQKEQNYAYEHSAAIGLVKEQLEYCDRAAEETGAVPCLLYVFDWQKFFAAPPDWITALAVLFLSVGMACAEYEHRDGTGAPAALIKATKHGRARLFRRKLAVTVLLSLLLAAAAAALDLSLAFSRMRLENASFPAFSLPGLEGVPVTVSLAELTAWMAAEKIAVTVLFSVFSFCLAELIRSRIAAMAAVVGITLIPALAGYYGVSLFRPVSLWDALAFTGFCRRGGLVPFLIGFTVLNGLLTLLALRRFCKKTC